MRILTLTALFAIGCGGSQVHGSDGNALPTTLSGQQLLAGEFTLAAVTSDGNALLLDANGDARAQPLGGGAATTFDSGSQLVVSSGPLGFSFHDYDPQVGFGTMSVWSSRGAAPNLAMNASYWQLAASSDGLVLVGTRNANLDGSAPSAEIFMSGFDGSNARTLWSGVSEAPGCLPLVGYLGSRFFVSHCPAGSTVATISTVDGSGAIVDLSSAAKDRFAVGGGGTRVLWSPTTGVAEVSALDGSAPLSLPTGIDSGTLSSDGSVALVISGHALSRVELASGATTSLASNASLLLAGSPDLTRAIYGTMNDPLLAASDLYLVDASHPGAPITLSAATQGALYGDAFTSDGTRVLYGSGATAEGVARLQSQPIGGGAVNVHGDAVWRWDAAGGTRVVFDADHTTSGDHAGRADLYVADSASSSRKIIATRIDEDFLLAPAGDHVLYTFSDGSARDGLYLAPIP